MSALQASTNLTPEEADLLPDAERFDRKAGERDWIAVAQFVLDRSFAELQAYALATGGRVVRDKSRLAPWRKSPDRPTRSNVSYFATDDGRRDGLRVATAKQTAPDVVVEVVTDSDSANNLEAKTHDYLKAGVAAVCVALPNLRHVLVYRSRTIDVYPAGRTLEDLPELPGFSCDVSSLFPDEDESDSAAGG